MTIAVGMAGTAAGVVVLALAAQLPGLAPLLLATALVVGNLALLRFGPWGPGAASEGESANERHVAVLAACWVFSIAFNLHDFSGRPTTSAVSQPGVQSALELGLFAVMALVAFLVLQVNTPRASLHPVVVAFPVWVLASVTWSDHALYTVARGVQYVALALLALASAGLAVRSIDPFATLVWTTVRWLVRVTLGLVILGLLLGPLYVRMTPSNRGRFTWVGAHPTASCLLLGACLLLVLGSPRDRIGLNGPLAAGAVAVLATALYANQTRTALAGMALGLAVLAWRHARRRPDLGVLALPYVVAGPALALVVAGPAIGDYVLRGGDASKLTSLNGRSDLWPVGIDALGGAAGWFRGLGFGATRVVFVEEFTFAGSAHNSVLGLLVNLGVVGVALMVALFLATSVSLARAVSGPHGELALPLLSLMGFLLATAATTDELAEPTFGTAVLFLGAAAVCALRQPAARPARSDLPPSLAGAIASRPDR